MIREKFMPNLQGLAASCGWLWAVALGSLLAVPQLAASAPLMSVSLSTPSAQVGDSLSASVHIYQVSDLYAYQFDLVFSPGLLATTAMSERTFLADVGGTIFLAGAIDNATGRVSFVADSLLGAISGANGDGDLVEFSFQALGAGLASVLIENVLLLDSSFRDITASLKGANLRIANGSSNGVPEPSTLMLVLPLSLLALARRPQPS